MHQLAQKRDQLMAWLGSLDSCAVAFSAGVDSTVVAKAAQLALGDRAVAVTAVSPSLPAGEREAADELARIIGIRHVILQTREIDNSAYRRNAPDRCFHCKTELYSQMAEHLAELGVAAMVNGANLDDLGDYRPGLQAAAEHRVQSPLVECRFTKQDVRELAAEWQLPVWNKPASPCLSSRIAYGEEVTPERLRMVDRAEQFLRARGFANVRVRLHRGDIARIEIAAGDIARLAEAPLRQALLNEFQSIGFKFVTLDLQGFRSGSLNDLIPLETLQPR